MRSELEVVVGLNLLKISRISKVIKKYIKPLKIGGTHLWKKSEIEDYTINANKAEIKFYNGSWIKVVTASDSGRGSRANILLVDEFRMVDKDTIDTVLKKFLTSPRQPLYLRNPRYKNRT